MKKTSNQKTKRKGSSQNAPTCKNCGQPLGARYCPACGQRDFDMSHPYWEFIEDLTDQLFTQESKLWGTFINILFVPGKITRHFLEGKRARYVPPIRLFLVALVLFFSSLAILDVALFKLSMVPNQSVFTNEEKARALEEIDEKIALTGEDDDRYREILVNLRGGIEKREVTRESSFFSVLGSDYSYIPQFKVFVPIGENTTASIDSERVEEFFETTRVGEGAGWLREFLAKVKNGFVRAAQDPRTLNNSVNIWLPRVMVIFVPMFGIFLWLFFWGPNRFLFNHLVFSLHFHTGLFFLLTILIVVQAITGGELQMIFFLGLVSVYLYFFLRNAYQNTWLKTFMKFTVIAFFYMIAFSALMATVFLMGLAEA